MPSTRFVFRPEGNPTTGLAAVMGLAAALVLGALAASVGILPALGIGALLLAALWLLLIYPFSGVLLAVFLLYTNLPVAAAHRDLIPPGVVVLVGALFIPGLLHQMLVRRGGIRLDRTFALMTGFMAVMLVSGFFALDVPSALSHVAAYTVEGLVIYLLILNLVRDRTALAWVVTVVVGAASLLAALTVYQAVSGNYHHQFWGLAERSLDHLEGQPVHRSATGMGLEDRAHGPMDDANRYAQILLVATCFALSFFWILTGAARTAALGACLLILAAVFLTYSRGAFLTLVVLALISGALRCISRPLLGAAIVGALLLVPVVAPGYLDRIQTIAGAAGLISADATVEPDGPTRGRTTQMLAALLAYREHPVLGVGPGQYVQHHSVRYQLRPEIAFRQLPEPRRAHNLYLELAAETGTVGLLLFLAIAVLMVRDLWQIRERARREGSELEFLAMGFILAILAYLGTGVFLHLAYQRYYWFLLALGSAGVWIMREELEKEAEHPVRGEGGENPSPGHLRAGEGW